MTMITKILNILLPIQKKTINIKLDLKNKFKNFRIF